MSYLCIQMPDVAEICFTMCARVCFFMITNEMLNFTSFIFAYLFPYLCNLDHCGGMPFCTREIFLTGCVIKTSQTKPWALICTGSPAVSETALINIKFSTISLYMVSQQYGPLPTSSKVVYLPVKCGAFDPKSNSSISIT